MKWRNNDAYSPNQVMGTILIAIGWAVFFCGQSLWVPASRIGNLYVRSIVLSLTDAGSALASASGLDRPLPVLRDGFLSLTGLKDHISWDQRYYNKRTASSDQPVSAPSSAIAPLSTQADTLTDAPAGTAGTGTTGTTTGTVASLPVERIVPPPTGGPAVIHSAEKPLNVFLFGDSQVFSLGSGLSRLVGKNSPLNVDFLAIHSSGFIRSDYYDWPAKIEDSVRTQQVEAAALMLGMNDYQNFWNDQGQIMKKGTVEWENAYKDKCRKIIDIVLASVPRLYWIGMPAVKNRAYDESLTYIDTVQASLAAEYSPDIVVRISLRDAIPGAGKNYSDTYELAGGKTIQVMSSDGTHFTVEGGQLAMRGLFDRLTNDYLFNTVPVATLPE